MALAFGSSLGTPNKDTENNTTSIALTTNVTVPASSFLLIGVSWYDAAATASVAGGSLTYAQDGTRAGVLDSSRHVSLFSAQAASGLVSGTTITATFTASSFGRAIFGMYVTGVATSSPLDGTAVTGQGSAGGSNVAWTTATSTTANADDLLVSAAWFDGSNTTNTAGGSNTEAVDTNNALNATWAMQYRIVAATGSYTVNGTWASNTGSGGSPEWIAVQAAYKASGGGGGAATVKQLAALGVGG